MMLKSSVARKDLFDLPFSFFETILFYLPFDKLWLFTLHDSEAIKDIALSIIFQSVYFRSSVDDYLGNYQCAEYKIYIRFCDFFLFKSQFLNHLNELFLSVEYKLIKDPYFEKIILFGKKIETISFDIFNHNEQPDDRVLNNIFRLLWLNNAHSLIRFKFVCKEPFTTPFNGDEENNVTYSGGLDIFQNGKNKTSSLFDLKKLKSLNLSHNKISEMTNLFENVVNLRYLDLSRNNINKIDNLSALPNLSVLKLNFNDIEKIEKLSKLISLSRLDINSNDIQKIKNLSALINLKSLNLSENLSNLTKLNLSANYINKIENLNNLSKIENLSNLLKLKDLDLSYNKIKTIENNCYSTLLNLAENEITSICLVLDLSIAQSLVSNLDITETFNLNYLRNVEKLNVKYNKVHTIAISNSVDFPSLKSLKMHRNELRKVTNFGKFINLTELNLSFNNIDGINHEFGNLLQLEELNLELNRIKSFGGNFFPKLKRLYLEHNLLKKFEI
ncbi:L domain-like protein [Ascoidea rubescens DSM 1968]|uniref:L domain-like protein n=1 Tax=Ascoidea rubescens DSM 1968 TaxID=1344418 RepID=A0A1D2VM79_9ASCO|nr:L domain-like protein [Ascoidea rubescens DSM 1968]ODV62711.1 L domain-like protein [Ascoidea rubescens DSM 1968]